MGFCFLFLFFFVMVLGVRMSSIDHDFVGFFFFIIIVVSGYFASFLLMGHA
jgi:FtsH-binding integral membrane protein